MNTKILYLILFTFILSNIISIPVYSQDEKIKKNVIVKIDDNLPPPGDEQFMPFLPDLTEQQKADIKKIHLKTMKEVLPLKNEIGEKEARLRTLMTADTPDLSAINKLVDEIGVLKTQIRKLELTAHLDIRKLLTDEQRLIMDSNPPKPFQHGPDGMHPQMFEKKIIRNIDIDEKK